MYVAVYGTLKKGYGNNRLLSSAQFIGEDTVTGYELRYSWGDSGFPVAFQTDGNEKIHIEIWDIGDDEGTLRRLDALEGVPSMYTREVVTTDLDLMVNIYVGGRGFKSRQASMMLVPLDDKNSFNWGR